MDDHDDSNGSMNASSFTDLRSYQSLDIQSLRQSGNVVKGDRVRGGGAHVIEIHEGGEGQPSIITHRDGDTIVAIEFVCSCGRRTTVNLDYAGE